MSRNARKDRSVVIRFPDLRARTDQVPRDVHTKTET